MITVNISHKVETNQEPVEFSLEYDSIEDARECIADHLHMDLQYGDFPELEHDGRLLHTGGHNGGLRFTGTYARLDNYEKGLYAHYKIIEHDKDNDN